MRDHGETDQDACLLALRRAGTQIVRRRPSLRGGSPTLNDNLFSVFDFPNFDFFGFDCPPVTNSHIGCPTPLSLESAWPPRRARCGASRRFRSLSLLFPFFDGPPTCDDAPTFQASSSVRRGGPPFLSLHFLPSFSGPQEKGPAAGHSLLFFSIKSCCSFRLHLSLSFDFFFNPPFLAPCPAPPSSTPSCTPSHFEKIKPAAMIPVERDGWAFLLASPSSPIQQPSPISPLAPSPLSLSSPTLSLSLSFSFSNQLARVRASVVLLNRRSPGGLP
ncbi:hypothetical protein V8E36_005630 [Tilletia maclaganii]